MGSKLSTFKHKTHITMFSTISNYIWGDNEEIIDESPAAPKAQEVDDWIVVGGTPKDFQDKRENKNSRPSPRSQRNSKQHLHNVMFGDGNSMKGSSLWNRATVSGNKNQMYKQNFSIKMAGNRNLKQC